MDGFIIVLLPPIFLIVVIIVTAVLVTKVNSKRSITESPNYDEESGSFFGCEDDRDD